MSSAQRAIRTRSSSRILAAFRILGPPCWIAEGPVGLEVCCYDDENPDIACTGMV
jgi:hypothetical protein